MYAYICVCYGGISFGAEEAHWFPLKFTERKSPQYEYMYTCMYTQQRRKLIVIKVERLLLGPWRNCRFHSSVENKSWMSFYFVSGVAFKKKSKYMRVHSSLWDHRVYTHEAMCVLVYKDVCRVLEESRALGERKRKTGISDGWIKVWEKRRRKVFWRRKAIIHSRLSDYSRTLLRHKRITKATMN